MAKNVSRKRQRPAAKPSSAKPSLSAKGRRYIELDLRKLKEEPGLSLPLLWADRMTMGLRTDIPVATLRFYSALSDRLSECCRIQTSVTHLRQIVDVICRNIGYYPTKPKS